MLLSLLYEDPRTYITIIFLVVFSVCCHEFFHAFAALKLGDSTAADLGYLTFNPLKQMGIASIFMLAILGVAWGQVPVDRRRLRGRYAAAIVAAAGPLTNLVLVFVFATCGFFLISPEGELPFPARMLCFGAIVNVMLAILNLLPFPGFDGYEILCAVAGRRLEAKSEWAKGGALLLMLLFFFFSSVIYEKAAEFLVTYFQFLKKFF